MSVAADERLEPFAELNARPGRVPWNQRFELIREQFPSVARLDWQKAFETDMGLFARIVEDILKLDAAEPGRPGPRPGLEYREAATRLRKLWGLDYATAPFTHAFQALCAARGYSLRQLARKTHLSRSELHRFQQGLDVPTAQEMEAIAGAFDKHPSYFVEWRMGYILALLAEHMAEVPEASVGFYRKAKKHARSA